ncbi:MAG: hypothetical protein AAF513_06505 [Pseudomonadota bacterium]
MSATHRLAILVGLVAALTGCGSGSSSGSSDAPAANPPPSPPPAQTSPDLTGVTPQVINLALDAGTPGSASFSFTNGGDADLTYTITHPTWIALEAAASGTVIPGITRTVAFSLTCDDADLEGTLLLATNDTDSTIEVRATCAQPATDAAIAKVTLNQAARVYDSTLDGDSLSTGVLAGRELLVRAFVTGSGSPPTGQVVLSNPGAADRTYVMQTPADIDSEPAAEGVLNATHYVVLPASAITADTRLRIEVGAARYPASDTFDLQVANPGALEVTLVPVTFEGQTPTLNGDTYLANSRKVLPIGELDVEIRAPYVFTGDYDLNDLLEEIANLRSLDGSSRLYHGVIIPPSGTGATTAGIAYVGFPVGGSIDLNGDSFVIAHEIGHNLDLGHAPGCGAPGPDENYPNAEGTVPDWGFDIDLDALVAPIPGRFDFMSYCNSLWVSRYHFNTALNYRAGSPLGFGPPSGRAGLHILGRMDDAGGLAQLQVLPVAHLAAPLSRKAPTHTLVAWDRYGQELLRHGFTPAAIEDAGGGLGFVLNVPAPMEEIHHLSVLQGAVEIHSQRQASQGEIALDVSAVENGVQLHWAPHPQQTVIVRDLAGRVVSANRRGRMTLPGQAQGYRVSVSNGQRHGVDVSLREGAQRLAPR